MAALRDHGSWCGSVHKQAELRSHAALAAQCMRAKGGKKPAAPQPTPHFSARLGQPPGLMKVCKHASCVSVAGPKADCMRALWRVLARLSRPQLAEEVVKLTGIQTDESQVLAIPMMEQHDQDAEQQQLDAEQQLGGDRGRPSKAELDEAGFRLVCDLMELPGTSACCCDRLQEKVSLQGLIIISHVSVPSLYGAQPCRGALLYQAYT